MTAIAATREVPGPPPAGESGPSPDDAAAETSQEALSRALAEVRAGRREAYERVVELCQSKLFGFALSLMKDSEAARELSQDAFVRAYRYLDRYDERRPFYPWLATIAVRLAQDRWQKLRRDRELARRYGATSEVTVSRVDPLDEMIDDERGRQLWRAVQDLPGGERAVVQLFYRQELSIRETARALGVSSGTVKTLLFRARRRLRAALGAAHRASRSRVGESGD